MSENGLATIDPALHARKDLLAKELRTLPEKISDDALAAFEAPEEIVLAGPEQLALFSEADDATLSLKVSKIRLDEGTAFKKRQIIRGTFLAVVTGEAEDDELDRKTRQPIRTVRHHKAVVLDVSIT